MTITPEVLFVCVHNAGRSQMAAARLNRHAAGRGTVRSAGAAPADTINQAVVEATARPERPQPRAQGADRDRLAGDGGEWVDDVNALRVGGFGRRGAGRGAGGGVHGGHLPARVHRRHVRKLDAVQEDLLQRAWEAGARPRGAVLKPDLDSTVIETYGLLKQGGKHFMYQQTRGYHPRPATIAESGEVVHWQLRAGRASAGRGAGSFARQALARVRRGTTAQILVRAESGFYTRKVAEACRRHRARFSISMRLQATAS